MMLDFHGLRPNNDPSCETDRVPFVLLGCRILKNTARGTLEHSPVQLYHQTHYLVHVALEQQ